MEESRFKFAERLNGRLAMLGVSGLALIEMAKGSGVMQQIQAIDPSNIWLMLGVYAS